MSIAHNIIEAHRTSDVLISENVDFASLLLSDYVIKGLKNAGFQKPSPIQLKAIPLGRCGLDLIVQAKSGTGKTCVFSVVALESIIVNSPAVQVLVLAPTREIAVQVWDVISSIGSAIPSLHCHTFIGGMPLSTDKKNTKSCQIAIGTPGRIKQLIEEGSLKTTSIRLFILDEADKLLEDSFQEQINWIYSALPVNKQMLALSATYPECLAQHLTRYMRNPTFIRLNITDPALLGIKQYYKMVSFHSMAKQQFDNKMKAVVDLLSSITFQQCLVFSNLQTRAQNLSDELQSQGWPTACIAGFHDQKDRNEAMARLKAYKCRVLISTDLSSRGIDAEKVNLIINLDVPRDHETYLHRIGRAGRYGSFGAAVTIVCTGEEEKSLKSLEKKCNTHIFPLPDPVPFDLVNIDLPISVSDVVSTEQLITRPDVAHQTDVSHQTDITHLTDVSHQTDITHQTDVSHQTDVCHGKPDTPSEDIKHQVEDHPECRISLDDEDDALANENGDDVLIHLPSHLPSSQSSQDSGQPLYNKIIPSENSFSVDLLPDKTEVKNDSNSFSLPQDVSLSCINIKIKTSNTKERKMSDPPEKISAEKNKSVNGIGLHESLPSASTNNLKSSTFYEQNTNTALSGNELDISEKSKCIQKSVPKDNGVDTVNNVSTDFKQFAKKKEPLKSKRSRSDNPNWRNAQEESQDAIHSCRRNKTTKDANRHEGVKKVRPVPAEFVQRLPSYSESIGYESVQHHLTYEGARESLKRFKQEDGSKETQSLLDMIKTKIDQNVTSVDQGFVTCVSECLAKFHTEFKEKTLRKTVLQPMVSFSSDVSLKPVLKAQVELTENRAMSVPFPDSRLCVRPKSRKGNFMASLDSPRQTAIQQVHQIHSDNLVQSLGDLKLDTKCNLEGSSESHDGYESDSSSSFSSLYEKDVYKNSYATEPEIQQTKEKVSTRLPSKLVLDGGPQENRPTSEPAPDNLQVEENHQTFWSLGPYTDPKHPFHDTSGTAMEPTANDLEACDVYPYGEPESKKSNIYYPYGEGELFETAEAEGNARIQVTHYPYGENPLTSSEGTSEHPEEELFYYKNVPPFGDPSVEWIQQDWQPNNTTNPCQQWDPQTQYNPFVYQASYPAQTNPCQHWDPNTQYNPFVYQTGYPAQTVPFPSYYPYPNPCFHPQNYYQPQNYYPNMYPPEAFYSNYSQWPSYIYPPVLDPTPQRSESLEKLQLKLIKRQKAYIKLMSKQRH